MNADALKRRLILIVLILGLLVVGFPFYWMLLTSLTPREVLFQPPYRFFRLDLSLENYRDLFFATDFFIYLKNSLIVAFGSIVLNVVAATLAGYGLTRFDFWAKRKFAQGILFSYMFPPMLMAIPLYIILSALQMRNTYHGIILAHASISLPLNIWLMWQYFQIVPISLEEAAWVSGASKFRAMREICLPSALPGILSVALFAFALSWNDFYLCLYPADGQKHVHPAHRPGHFCRTDGHPLGHDHVLGGAGVRPHFHHGFLSSKIPGPRAGSQRSELVLCRVHSDWKI